jgi:hypothetical protein
MGREPGDHRKAEPVHVIGKLVQIGTIDAGIDQDQPTLPAHRDGIAPDPRALTDPDAVGHLIQHRLTLSGTSTPAQITLSRRMPQHRAPAIRTCSSAADSVCCGTPVRVSDAVEDDPH